MLIGKEKMWLGSIKKIPRIRGTTVVQYSSWTVPLPFKNTFKRGGNFKNSIFSYNALHINCNP